MVKQPERRDEWLRFIAALVLAAVVAYFTTVARVSTLEERELNHYTELLRIVLEIKADVKELTGDRQGRPKNPFDDVFVADPQPLAPPREPKP